jgi:hypothetical protein
MLTHLRNDAVAAWTEALGLACPAAHAGLPVLPDATPEQIQIALKFAVTAQANYTLALWRKINQDEQEHQRQDEQDVRAANG